LELLLAETELVRQEIGAPKERRPAVAVRGAQPRENYFEALSLCRKAQSLCFQQTGDEGPFPPPAPPADRLAPAHVLAVVDAALQRILRVKAHLGVFEQRQEPPRDEGKTPSDVFRSLVEANRQLGLMLDTRPTPTAVYEQLTEAVGAANRLLARFPGAAEPAPPPLVRGKTPADVHGGLMRCGQRLRAIMNRSGLTGAEIDWKLEPAQVTPSDVYDLATLLVSELLYLEARLPHTPLTPGAIDFLPGRKLPAHNVQRAGLLESQLEQLRKQVEAHPQWLAGAKPQL
jgi:hypothetical protein